MLSCCISAINKLALHSTKSKIECTANRLLHLTDGNSAARKGTREKARKKKVKIEVKKVGFIPHNQRGKDKLKSFKINKHLLDTLKPLPPNDNVIIGRFYRWPCYTIEEAIKCHRESNHPTMYGNPMGQLLCDIELNMQGEKKTRFIDNFQRIVSIPHTFEHGEERKIIVVAKGEDHINAAKLAGATLAGDQDVIKSIQSGEIDLAEYQYIIAHPNIMPELVAVRGLMKRKFPNPKNGSLGVNIAEMVNKFINGVQYKANKDENQQDFGVIQTVIGTIDMDIMALKENIIALIKDVNSVRPKREGSFITRVLLKCPPSAEKLKIDPFLYVSENNKKSNNQMDDDDDNDDADAAAADDADEEKANDKKKAITN